MKNINKNNNINNNENKEEKKPIKNETTKASEIQKDGEKSKEGETSAPKPLHSNKKVEEHHANISTINISKEQNDLLLLENAGLKKDNELYKTKLLSFENELRNLKAENTKLQKENAAALKELIKKKDEEIEKLNSMNKDRMNILTELEEKTKINMENNKKIYNTKKLKMKIKIKIMKKKKKKIK